MIPIAMASQGDQKAREACTPDVMRLCNDYVPDIPQIVACLKRAAGESQPRLRRDLCGRGSAAGAEKDGENHLPKKKTDTKVAEEKKPKPQKVGAPLSLSATSNKATR